MFIFCNDKLKKKIYELRKIKTDRNKELSKIKTSVFLEGKLSLENIDLRNIKRVDFNDIELYCQEESITKFLPFIIYDAEKMISLINSNSYQWLVILYASNIVGDIVCELKQSKVTISIRLSNSYRSRGIGSTALTKTMSFLKSIGWTFNAIYAGISINNLKSISFFQRNGFIKKSIDNDGFLEYVKKV